MNQIPDYTEHYYQSLDGLRLYYRNYGAGNNVIICLPGLTRNSKDFEDLARQLAEKWRVLCPDLRGRGRSEWDPDPSRYCPETYVSDIWKLLDDLAIERAVVIGTSLGGLMAMIMAFQQPLRLRAVILNDVGPVIPPAALARIMKYAGRMPRLTDWQSAAACLKKNHEISLPNMPKGFWSGFVRLSMVKNNAGFIVPDMDPAIAEVLRKSQRSLKMIRWLNRLGLMKKTVAIIDNGYWDQFRAISMPCLLLYGMLSDVLPLEIVAQMKANNPDLVTASAIDRGHAPLLDETEIRSAILAFLARLLHS